MKIKFVDFWRGFDHSDYLVDLLKGKIDFVAGDEDPDVLLFSVFGYEHLNYDCMKILYTGENVKPDYRFCDYSFSFEETDERNYQMPNFVRHAHFQEFRSQLFGWEVEGYRSYPKMEFCNFLYSNDKAEERKKLMRLLAAYKKVDSPGKVLNNMPPIETSKFDFLKKYKFTIAFENESAVGYTTEKIYHSFLVGSIPIYWGNPRVAEYFNPESFINCHDYPSFEDVVARVIEIDQDDSLYKKYLKALPFLAGSKIYQLTDENFIERFEYIFAKVGVVQPVSKTLEFRINKAKKRLSYLLPFFNR